MIGYSTFIGDSDWLWQYVTFFLQITLLLACFNIFVAAFSDPLKIITDVVCLIPLTLFINFLFNSPKGQTIKKAYP